MKRIAILYSEYTPTIDAIIGRLKDCEVKIFTEIPNNIEAFDLIVSTNFHDIDNNLNILKVHHSLLPSFDCEEPVKQAFLEGVKVTGITIFYENPRKIITQYPIIISNNSHFDETERELDYLEQTLYPLIIDAIINNKTFDVKTMLNGSCGGCGNCGGCSKCL